MKEETCISLSLRDRTDLGINQLLAERITLQRALPPWPNVPFQKKKKKKMEFIFPTQTMQSEKSYDYKGSLGFLAW